MKSVALLLDEEENRYQQLLAREAKTCAERCGVAVSDAEFSGGSSWAQLELINAHLRRTPRPDAILVVLSGGQWTRAPFERVARKGVGLAFLNRIPTWIDELRDLFPTAFVAAVAPHQEKVGEAQGKQALRLARPGAFVILVTGVSTSAAAIARKRGFLNTVQGRYAINDIDGRWSTDVAEKALAEWFRLGAERDRPIDLVVCQNDAMASGIRKALAARAAASGRAELDRIPLIGCDGLVEEGQAMVERKELAATVVMPPTTPPALEMLRRYWDSGTKAGTVFLDVESFPALVNP
jgi:ABC-type sugar transport system substrate-binding protein